MIRRSGRCWRAIRDRTTWPGLLDGHEPWRSSGISRNAVLLGGVTVAGGWRNTGDRRARRPSPRATAKAWWSRTSGRVRLGQAPGAHAGPSTPHASGTWRARRRHHLRGHRRRGQGLPPGHQGRAAWTVALTRRHPGPGAGGHAGRQGLRRDRPQRPGHRRDRPRSIPPRGPTPRSSTSGTWPPTPQGNLLRGHRPDGPALETVARRQVVAPPRQQGTPICSASPSRPTAPSMPAATARD